MLIFKHQKKHYVRCNNAFKYILKIILPRLFNNVKRKINFQLISMFLLTDIDITSTMWNTWKISHSKITKNLKTNFNIHHFWQFTNWKHILRKINYNNFLFITHSFKTYIDCINDYCIILYYKRDAPGLWYKTTQKKNILFTPTLYFLNSFEI